MNRLLREPLAHFLLIGALLFVIYAWNQDRQLESSQDRIVVTAGRIEQLNTIFQKTWQRPPTPNELKHLIDEFVLEEVYYRKAIEMGIDRDDTMIRRRLRQKLEFLTDDAADLVLGTDEDLATYLSEHQDKFRESPKYTFRQVYLNPGKHNDKDEKWFREQLELLMMDETSVGDPSLIDGAFSNATRRTVDATFGTGFSTQVDELEKGKWTGPIRSGLGLHFIRLDEREEGRLPSLEEIKPIVQREWSNERRIANRKAMNDELLKGFEVEIDWPTAEVDNAATISESDSNSGAGDP